MHAFVLAGGFATRLWPLTEKRAKPLLPLAGKPLLNYAIEQIPADVPVTVSTNAGLAEGFEDWKKTEGFERVEIMVEDTTSDDAKLGALGALAQWITDRKIDDDVLLLAGDNYCGFALADLLDAFHGQPMLAAYDIKDKEQAKAFGTVIPSSDKTHAQAFEEKPADPKSTLVSTGWSILPRSALPVVTEYARLHPDNIGGIFEELLRRDIEVGCFVFTEPWFDIGSFQAYLEATRKLVGRHEILGTNAELTNCKTAGSVVLGDNSIARDCDLTNVVVFEDCELVDCVLEDCIIDTDCRLKGVDLTGKMLRSGTVLGF